MEKSSAARFPLGFVMESPGVLASIPQDEIAQAIERHGRGDWGELCPDDVQENEFSLTHNFSLLSAYVSAAGIHFWVVTEADRSATTVLLPEEY